MTVNEVPTTPSEVENYLGALLRACGWCVETRVILRDEGTEILEIDSRAVRFSPFSKEIAIAEAKSGKWGAPDVFKLLGWQTYLKADLAIFASTKTSAEVSDRLRHHAEKAGVVLIHFTEGSNPLDQASLKGLGTPSKFEFNMWQYAAKLELKYRKGVADYSKTNHNSLGALAITEHNDLVSHHVLFLQDPVDQAFRLYEAHYQQPRLALGLAREMDGHVFDPLATDPSPRLASAMMSGSDLPLQCAMWVEYRSRLAILRAAAEIVIAMRVNAITKNGDVDLGFLASGFKNGIEWLGQQPTFWNYPLLWEQFCWTWGGFLLMDDLKAEYDQLSISSGVPADEVPSALTAFDQFFPISNGWFVVPGPTNAKRLILFPFHFHGIGAFRRFLRGRSKTVSALGDHTLDDLIRWNNETVALLQD